MQSTADADPSALEQQLAARLRQALQGCTQHIHGPVAAFGEIRSQPVRVDVIRELIQDANAERQKQLLAAGAGENDPRYRKEAMVSEFTECLLTGAETCHRP